MTRVGGPFEPAIDRVPANSFCARNGGLVQAFDAEGGDLIEGRATMLDSMVRRPGVGAEGLAASLATVATTPSPFRPVRAVTDDSSGSGISRQRTVPVCAAETLHCSWTGRQQDWSPGIEPQILAGTGVTIGPPTVDDGSTSVGSQVLRRSQTPLERTCQPFGSAPSRTGLDQIETLQRSPGSRACCFSTCSGSSATQGRTPPRDRTRTPVWPSLFANKIGTLKEICRSSIARPADASVYASNVASRRRPQDSRSRWFATPSL